MKPRRPVDGRIEQGASYEGVALYPFAIFTWDDLVLEMIPNKVDSSRLTTWLKLPHLPF